MTIFIRIRIRTGLHAAAFLAGAIAALGSHEAPAATVGILNDTASTMTPIPLEASARDPWNELPEMTADPSATVSNLIGGAFEGATPATGSDDLVSVLVHLDPSQDRGRRVFSSARHGIKVFAQGEGARVHHEYDILPNVVNLRSVPRRAIAALERVAGVRKVELDYEVRASLNQSVSLIRGLQSQIQAAGIAADGAGIRICVCDTGIDSNHVMYSERIDSAAGYDFVNGDLHPEDDNGHGSHVAGIALGSTGLSFSTCGSPAAFQGTAPSATLIGMKVLNASGSGTASNIIAGINRCASPSLPGGPADVINLSLGGGQFIGTCDGDLIAQAANNAVQAGVVVVAAAGNGAFVDGLSTPACASQVISVGAVYDDAYPNCEFPSQHSFTFCTAVNVFGQCIATCTDDAPFADQRVCFSNRSSTLDVAAPGCIVLSADASSAAGTSVVGQCGTSQAAPHVSGLAALLLSVSPLLTPGEVRQLIRSGAVDLGSPGFDSLFGYGRIDVVNSLALAFAGCNSDPDCDDGNFCNGAESCDGAGNCQPGVEPCGDASCDEVSDRCSAPPEIWLTFIDSAVIPGLGVVENEDIVARNEVTGVWSLVFDGSDVGLAGLVIDAMARLPSGDILLSFTQASAIPGMADGPGGSTTLDDSDIVRFVPTTLGETTAGIFSFYFDGSDVGLTTNAEDVDAIGLTPDGDLVLSTTGAVTATGAAGSDTDLLVFAAISLGSVTTGSFSVYFDGSDVGLADLSGEDLDAVGITQAGVVLLSTVGSVSVPGLVAQDEDVVAFSPTTIGDSTAGVYSLQLDLSFLGIVPAEDVGAIEWVEP